MGLSNPQLVLVICVRFISCFVFRQFWRRSYENQLSLSGKDSTSDFFVSGHFDENTKNEKCNELDNNVGKK